MVCILYRILIIWIRLNYLEVSYPQNKCIVLVINEYYLPVFMSR